MELRHMRYFLAVGEELNFRKAAERQSISQPSLSVQIQDMEDEVGTLLLERTTHRVALTPAGLEFLESCRRPLLAGGAPRVRAKSASLPVSHLVT